MTDPSVGRAAERVTLACRTLSAAANDLRVEYKRHGLAAVDDAATDLEMEVERVCELAGEVERLAISLKRWSAVEVAAK